MLTTGFNILATILVVAIASAAGQAVAQTLSPAAQQVSMPGQLSRSSSAWPTPETLPLEHQNPALMLGAPQVSWELQPLVAFKDGDVKFNLSSLMNTLRDSRHEGWMLAAYPDPKTSRPLIGAGFGLDVDATEHLQHDPLNPNRFLEPSTAQLWQAAGLDSQKLQSILDQFDRDLEAWQKKKFRRKIRTHALPPQLTEAEATRLLRISSIQAALNARAYCRIFDQLTASQQMALSQLVFQMGVNLEEFVQFLGAVNDVPVNDVPIDGDPAQPMSDAERQADHWIAVQTTLIESDWARRYTSRAVSVIAMFDPEYQWDAAEAERKVMVQIHPLVTHPRKKRHTAVRAAKVTHKRQSAHRTVKS